MKLTLLQRRGRTSTTAFTTTLHNSLSKLKGNLSVTGELTEHSPRGWAIIDIQGADQEIFQQLIKQKIPIANSNFQTVEKHGVYAGQITRFNHDLEVDIGVEFPDQVNVIVRLSSLRAQLTEGKPISVKEIQDAYCLFPGNRVDVRITMISHDEPILTGWLADSQVDSFSDWIRSGLDHVIIFDCTIEQLDSAIRETRLERDIVAVESLTLTTHVVACKLGTDGVGLIPKLGGLLRKSEIKLFIPKRILTISHSW
ncbi:MAG TPA: DUF2110 family protein [Candidatus Bathyarchaeia archaeon]|nr:DUF2110 family protein [Candidatus Bathyarchaeia archaeon]